MIGIPVLALCRIDMSYKIGIDTSKKHRKNCRIMTVVEALPVLRTHQPYKKSPGKVPIATKTFKTKKYYQLIRPKTAMTMVPQPVTNKVKYMPVADPEAGCMSREMRTGLKIDPVPRPVKAPASAPKKAIKRSLT